MTVHIGDIQTFKDISPDKTQALKPLEEAAETFAAWQRCANRCWLTNCKGCDVAVTNECKDFVELVDECCDTVQAACNLLASLGVTDLSYHMKRCEQRNRARGRL